jgi:hypothetical protein
MDAGGGTQMIGNKLTDLPPIARQFVLDDEYYRTASLDLYAGMPSGQERTTGLLPGGFEIIEAYRARRVSLDLPRAAFKLK